MYDYTAKRGVEACFILAPDDAPSWAQDRAALWNAAEARDAWAEAREEGQGHVSAGLAALSVVAGRQEKELDQDELTQRLTRIAGRDLGRDKPDPGTEHQRKLEVGRQKQHQLELERRRERNRGLGWEL